MTQLSDGETAQSICEATGSTRWQLARWHRAGLLPRPAQRRRGRKGTESVYPLGTSARVTELLRIQRGERRLAYIAFELWWRGYDVRIGLVRTLLRTVETRMTRAAGAPLPSAEELRRSRLPHGSAGRMRRRVGREKFPLLVHMLSAVVSGRPDPSEVTKENALLVERALDLRRARIDRVLDADPWLPRDEDMRPVLTEFADLFRKTPFREVVERTADEDLLKARDQLRAFTSLMSTFGVLAQAFAGRGSFGLTELGKTFLEFGPSDRARLFLLWLVIRRSEGMRKGMEPFVALAGAWQAAPPPEPELLERLRGAAPDLARTMDPKRVRKALRSRGDYRTLLDETKKVADKNRRRIREVLSEDTR